MMTPLDMYPNSVLMYTGKDDPLVTDKTHGAFWQLISRTEMFVWMFMISLKS